jgi:hypothetical protein
MNYKYLFLPSIIIAILVVASTDKKSSVTDAEPE